MNYSHVAVNKIRAKVMPATRTCSQRADLYAEQMIDNVNRCLADAKASTFVIRTDDCEGPWTSPKGHKLKVAGKRLYLGEWETPKSWPGRGRRRREIVNWTLVPFELEDSVITEFSKAHGAWRVWGHVTPSEDRTAYKEAESLIRSKLAFYKAKMHTLSVLEKLDIDALRDLATGPGGKYLFMRLYLLSGLEDRCPGGLNPRLVRVILSRMSKAGLKHHYKMLTDSCANRMSDIGHACSCLTLDRAKNCPDFASLARVAMQAEEETLAKKLLEGKPTPPKPPVRWTVDKTMEVSLLRPGLEFSLEGAAMHHCVGHYSNTSIILRIDGDWRGTAEISWRGEIIQLRGLQNMQASLGSENTLQRWLAANFESLRQIAAEDYDYVEEEGN